MTADRTELDGDRARAFHRKFESRSDYIAAELIHHYVDGPERVPLPGCPECAVPADQVAWSVYDDPDVIEVDVDPCGHRFTVQRPIMETTTDEQGRTVTVQEWMP